MTDEEHERYLAGDKTAILDACARAEAAGLTGRLLVLPPPISEKSWEEKLAEHRDHASERMREFLSAKGIR
jgi:hypothetical protein